MIPIPCREGPHDAMSHKISELERKAKLEDQLKRMAGAPVRRKRRVIKPMSKVPTPQPEGVSFTATSMDSADCPSDGCPTEGAAPAAAPPPEATAITADVIAEEEVTEKEEEEEKVMVEEVAEEEEEEEIAPAPPRRRRRVIKPLSKTPTAQPTAPSFTNEKENKAFEAAAKAAAEAVAAAKAEAAETAEEDARAAPEPGSAEEFFSHARNVRGYQSARHSTESAHERINAQLAGLHRKKVIRARARGETVYASDESGTVHPTTKGGVRKGGVEMEEYSKAARFYGGVGLQLEAGAVLCRLLTHHKLRALTHLCFTPPFTTQ